MAFGDDAYCQKVDVVGLGEEFTIPAAWTDADVDATIVEATRQIDSVCGDHFGSSTAIIIVDGSGTRYLDLRNVLSWALISVTSIFRRNTYAATDDFAANGAQLDDDAYAIADSKNALVKVLADDSSLRGIATTSPVWIAGTKNYRIEGEFGRNVIPPDIRFACALLVRERITPGSSQRYEALRSERFPDGYAYQRPIQAPSIARANITLTGYPAIDDRLRPFVIEDPVFVAIT